MTMGNEDKKISELPALETVSGDELLVVAKGGGNGSVTMGQIVAKARQGLVAQVPGKGLSTNDFTDVLKAKLDSLKNYDDAALRAAVKALEGQLDTILGDGASAAIDTFNEIEAFLTGITDTQTLTGLLAELKSAITGETDTKLEGKVDKVSGKGLSANDYSDAEKGKLAGLPTGAELETALAAKLDKAVWDGEHAQFNIVGYYSVNTGKTGTAYTWRRTPLIVLNRNAPIVFRNLVLNSDAGIVFFDADRRFISGMGVDSGLNDSQQIAVADFPEGAVYVGLSTFVSGSGDNHNASYSNGETVESREGAIAERIIADRETENAQFGLSGYWYSNGKVAATSLYRRTGLIPVSRDYDIVAQCWGAVNVMALVLFDASGAMISTVPCNTTVATAEKTVTVAAADIPEAAAFFAASTEASRVSQSHWSNGPTREAREGAVSDAAAAVYAEAQRAVFDHIYAAYGVTKDPATGLYSLNGLTDITEAEMLAIYVDMQRAPGNVIAGANRGNLRTNLWVATGISASDNEITVRGMFDGWGRAEVLNIYNGYTANYTTKISGGAAFRHCSKLKKILGVFRLFTHGSCSVAPFQGCAALEELSLTELKYSVSFADSPLLSLASLEYLVANAANTGPITVTVHPDVYAKLTNTDGLEDYLPANMVKTQRAASTSPNCSYADGVWTIQRQNRDTYLSLSSDAVTAGRPYAMSMNVDGMAEGEEWQFYLNGGTASGVYFKMKQGACSGVLYPKSSTSDYASIDDVSREGVDMSLTTPITVTDIMVVPGETAAPKWAPHPDEIEDAELRERVKWANLVYVAAAKQITFASV